MTPYRRAVVGLSVITVCMLVSVVWTSLDENSSVVFPLAGFVLLLLATLLTVWRGDRARQRK